MAGDFLEEARLGHLYAILLENGLAGLDALLGYHPELGCGVPLQPMTCSLDDLAGVTESHLEGIGLKPLGDRIRLVKSINELEAKAPPHDDPVLFPNLTDTQPT